MIFDEPCATSVLGFFFSSRRRHTSSTRDWSSDVCSSDLDGIGVPIVNYLVSGDLRTAEDKEIDRLRRQLDVAHRFGARIFRHDVAPWAWREQDQGEFESTFEKVVEGCR